MKQQQKNNQKKYESQLQYGENWFVVTHKGATTTAWMVIMDYVGALVKILSAMELPFYSVM